MTSRDPARLRQGLHPLTTTLGVFNSSLHSPISAVSMSSSHLQSAAQTPGSSTIQPYNPQEWVPSQAAVAVAERPVQFAGEAQVGPLPPPPYSPPRSQQQQQQQQQRPMSIYDSTPASTPPPRLNTAMHRPSPEPQIANPSFPPPPGGRGNSRERRFGIPTLARRRDVEQATSPPQTHMAHNHRQSMIIQPSFNQQNPDAAAGFPHGPPAARRAVSAGAIETPTSARSRSASQTRWEPGMPLPPPPPGPPPPSGRSQSVQSMDRNVVPIISPPTRRRPPAGVTNLGPVPPTPADWVDSDQPNAPGRGRSPALTLNTSVNPNPQLESVASSSSVSSLNRQKAVRHDKTILQRRNESRNRHSTRGSVDERIRPESMADIVVPSSSDLARSTLSKSTPLTDAFSQSSRDSTPRALGSAKLPQVEAETPPFSPNAAKQPQYASSKAVAPKALPTPPPRSGSAASVSRVRESSRPPSAGRAVPKHLAVTQTADQFATDTIERFREFAAKESRAATDADRVRLFADFIVNESRIRRERYSNAIGAMGSEIFDLTRDLFRPMATERRTSGTSQDGLTPGFSEPTRSRRGSASSAFQGESSQSAPGSANVPVSPNGANPPALNWATNYMPSLSPILSMSVSENYENGSSRGRPPSRWWETDSQGNPSHLERSKRESKYMGVTKTQWVEGDQPPAVYEDQGSSSEYPPEKTGWHDQSEPSLTPQPSAFSTSTSNMGSSPCSTVNREHLDVSRLVTMPPPYPRHHPAVNNNHPELTSIRTAVRALSELDQVTKTKEKFETESTQRREQFAQAASERRQALRTNLQNEINSGSLSYSDAAVIESDTQTGEISKKKELEKSEYEQFQNQVVLPLNELLMGRISRATELFDDLARHLIDNGIDADMPQEEGDDRPELLEKLTLLKWIFEAREGLHRAIYDLLSDRNSRYCGVVLTPYRLSGNTEKLKSAEAFFAEDAAKREYAYAHEVLERVRDFRGVVEKAVERGVALQLSAFWDIAPPLCELLDNIPVDLEGFNIQIPAAEFEENPSYHEHPMQYLFSLILHAEKSTYQFIESHTNLLCLLHEVKEAVVHAKGKVLETQTQDENGNPIPKADRDARAQHMRQSEERRLTEDLKEKVRVVQDQWRSALGENITLVKERLGEWLLQMGGWDESLEDGGVGGV